MGRHAAGCPHAANRVPYTLRGLARAVFGDGRAGGRQTTLIRGALDELAAGASVAYWHGDRGHRFNQVSGILRYLDNSSDGTGRVAWDPVVLESLLLGRYQLVPPELVGDLSGPATLLWLQVLSQRQRRDSAATEISVTGRDARLPPSRLGLGRSRGDRMRTSLETSAAAGNRVQSLYRLTVLNRTSHGGGLKLRLERNDPPGAHRRFRRPSLMGCAPSYLDDLPF